MYLILNFFSICEFVGLDVTKDRILEIACVITDGKLTRTIEVS
jgi:oligoribonuclease (3'-5' exoribonuclease)